MSRQRANVAKESVMLKRHMAARFSHTEDYAGGSVLLRAEPALFPTIGSPNLTLTGIALAQRLGDHLVPEPPPATPEPGFTYLFDGNDAPFADWQKVGGGSFSRFGRTMIAQQDGRGIGLLFYKPRSFQNFILRLDFLLPHPRGVKNDNSASSLASAPHACPIRRRILTIL